MINEQIKKAISKLIEKNQGMKFCAADVAGQCSERIYTIRRNLKKLENLGWLETNWEPWMNGDTKYYSVVPGKF